MENTLVEYLFQQYRELYELACENRAKLLAIRFDTVSAIAWLEGDKPNIHNTLVCLRNILDKIGTEA